MDSEFREAIIDAMDSIVIAIDGVNASVRELEGQNYSSLSEVSSLNDAYQIMRDLRQRFL